MRYRELHFSSEDRDGGDDVHPLWELKEEIELDYFALKNIQIPRSWLNVRTDQYLFFYNEGDGVPEDVGGHYFTVKIPAGTYDVTQFAVKIQENLRLANDSYGEVNPFLTPAQFAVTAITSPTVPSAGSLHLRIANIQNRVVLANFARNNPDVYRFVGFDGNLPRFVFTCNNNSLNWFTNPLNPFMNRYLFLRSNAMNGSHFTSHISMGKGSFKSGQILAKIPISTAIFGINQYIQLSFNENPTKENMFKFNGSKFDKMDLYLTGPDDDIPIDFREFPWSCTIAILSQHD